MSEHTPEALARLRQVASAETGAGRMFTLDDAAEIVAYIDRLEARPEPRQPDELSEEDEACCPPHCCCCGPGEQCCDCGETISASEPLPDAVERVARALCHDKTAREIAGQALADAYEDSEPEVQEYWRCIARAALSAMPASSERACTCHPGDRQSPCPQKFAASECASSGEVAQVVAWLREGGPIGNDFIDVPMPECAKMADAIERGDYKAEMPHE